jgi:protease-4
VYNTFIGRVAEGRKMKLSDVDSIGQGRVWTGKDALAINLVDELGGLSDAIAYAAKKANLNEYKLIELPKPKNPFADFMGKTETEAETRIAKKNLGITYSYLKQIQNIISIKGVQARLPFEMIFE